MSTSSNDKGASPGRLLRLTLQVYGNNKNKPGDNEAFAREYLTKVASINARNGIEMYQQVFTPAPYRAALEEMNRRGNRGWVVDDHDITVEFYFRTFAELEKMRADPDFQELQAAEGPYVNLVHTVVTLGWVEKYVDGGRVVNVGSDGKSVYPPWSELQDLSTVYSGQTA
ncbi:hypothetical protein F5Y00DRAFT_245075 [Daldinia vernicosa]|uniref:uncharacterized protein n=1 Tax=Daldinia vernicosa TaxID=114800 RepID=UPI002007A2F6|nr:uncharacterized protein F5Y00DRAFT_245075 [Daldinia vernicosa]KAI0845989.1 hypothetical protein F5Y00DRAFT_245075 [Daldinia vernicosa]